MKINGAIRVYVFLRVHALPTESRAVLCMNEFSSTDLCAKKQMLYGFLRVVLLKKIRYPRIRQFMPKSLLRMQRSKYGISSSTL